MDNIQELKLITKQDTLDTVLGAVEEMLEAAGCPMDVMTVVMIAVEEIYVNIVHYAYGGKEGEAVVRIEVSQDPKLCRVTFKDQGIPYDPLKKEDPDITLSAEERQIGGLGIFMVKQSMDRIDYRYEGGSNILTIEKEL